MKNESTEFQSENDLQFAFAGLILVSFVIMIH